MPRPSKNCNKTFSSTSNHTRESEKSVSTFSTFSECKGNDEGLQYLLRRIHRPRNTFTRNVVRRNTIKHFAEEFVVRMDTATRIDRSVPSSPRKHPS